VGGTPAAVAATMDRRHARAAVSALALLVPACATDVMVEDGLNPVIVTALDRTYDDAARESGVPADLLKAIGYVETRWQMVTAEEEHEGAMPTVGLMGVRPGVAARGATLAGVGVEDLAVDAEANIRAAAQLIAEEARVQGVTAADDIVQWVPVVEAWSGIEDPEARAHYVGDDVYRVLRDGAEERTEGGELVASLAPNKTLTGSSAAPVTKSTEYGPAIWRPSPNYGSRPSGVTPSMVIIHTCEGGYAGCWGWLKNPQSGVSAHYVVNESGSEITQLVLESKRAYHIAATYKCSLNGSTDCGKNGQSSNNFTIGIEHGGYGSQASWPAGQIEASAKLVCDITKSHAIPRDRNHIVGHGQLQPYNRTDPGPNWPWAHYIDRVRDHCATATPPPPPPPGEDPPPPPPPPATQIVIDSNSANNNAAVARVELTGTWTSASSTPGYYGTGYWQGATAETSAPATFYFYLSAAQTRTIDAWWTTGSNRLSNATFIAYNAAGTEVGRSTQNQQANGSTWNQLGTYAFTAGWNKVVLSRWAPTGKVVIADAVRVR
jgi:N-acetyl-anhydromuramyl-L-alanine amidase AmpD